MADLPSGGEHHFVCVETANTGEHAITVAPGSPLQVRIPLEARYAGALLAKLLPAHA